MSIKRANKIILAWEETPRWKKESDFSDWDANRGNGASSHRKNDDDSSDLR